MVKISLINLVCYVFVVLIFLISSTRLYAETSGFSEYKIKAGFVYNFTRFIRWPEKSFEKYPASFNLCILGDDPFGDHFRAVEGKEVMGRKLIIERLKREESMEPCQILFISKSEEKHMSAILESLEGKNVLTLGDTKEFAKSGGIIGLIKKGDRITLEINIDAAKRAELAINTKLLEISRIIRKKRGKEHGARGK